MDQAFLETVSASCVNLDTTFGYIWFVALDDLLN